MRDEVVYAIVFLIGVTLLFATTAHFHRRKVEACITRGGTPIDEDGIFMCQWKEERP